MRALVYSIFLKFLTIALLAVSVSSAFAEKIDPASAADGNGGGKGGGFAYVCGGRIYLADTIEIVQKLNRDSFLNLDPLLQMENLNPMSKVVPGFGISAIEMEKLGLDSRGKTLPELFKDLPDLVAENWHETDSIPLHESNNLFVERAPKGCKPVQIALQDLSTGEVKYVRLVFDQLSKFEQRLLQAHEFLVSKLQASGSTLPVRALISSLAAWLVADFFYNTPYENLNQRYAYVFSFLDLALRNHHLRDFSYAPFMLRGLEFEPMENLVWGKKGEFSTMDPVAVREDFCPNFLNFPKSGLLEEDVNELCRFVSFKAMKFGDLVQEVVNRSKSHFVQ